MNTTEPKTEKSDIDRIAERMVHRAHDSTGFLAGIEAQIAILTMRLEGQDPGRDEKLDELRVRKVRLTVAIADYKKAEALIRLFPALLWAARAGLEKLEGSADSDIKIIAGLIKRAVIAGEDALK